MKVLIIEDDELKYRHLVEFLIKDLNVLETEIEWQTSYKSGLEAILEKKYAFILLDMSMHIFERVDDFMGGGFESYAGVLILDEVDLYDVDAKIIVVTGYDVYGDGKTLSSLKGELRKNYGQQYLDTVYFVSNEDRWKEEIKEIIKNNDLWKKL